MMSESDSIKIYCLKIKTFNWIFKSSNEVTKFTPMIIVMSNLKSMKHDTYLILVIYMVVTHVSPNKNMYKIQNKSNNNKYSPTAKNKLFNGL